MEEIYKVDEAVRNYVIELGRPMYGSAIMAACNGLKDQLKPFGVSFSLIRRRQRWPSQEREEKYEKGTGLNLIKPESGYLLHLSITRGKGFLKQLLDNGIELETEHLVFPGEQYSRLTFGVSPGARPNSDEFGLIAQELTKLLMADPRASHA